MVYINYKLQCVEKFSSGFFKKGTEIENTWEKNCFNSGSISVFERSFYISEGFPLNTINGK